MVATKRKPEQSVANKKPKNERKTEKVEFMVTPQWLETFTNEAESWGTTLSEYVRLACEEKRRRDNADKKAD